MSKRIMIKASTYHGKNGFTVYAGRGCHIFCTTREMAEEYRAMLRLDLPFDEQCKRSREILGGAPAVAKG